MFTFEHLRTVPCVHFSFVIKYEKDDNCVDELFIYYWYLNNLIDIKKEKEKKDEEKTYSNNVANFNFY